MDRTKLILFILFAITLFLVGIIMLVFMFLSNNRPSSNPVFTTPTPNQIIPTESLSPASPLTLVSIIPPEDTIGKNNYPPGTPITFTFNKEIDPGKFYIEVTPEENLNTEFGESPKQVVVLPEFGWDANTLYTITIKKGTTALDGGVLQNDIIYKIKTTLNQGGV